MNCRFTRVAFEEASFDIRFQDNVITINQGEGRCATVTLVNQQAASKASIIGGFALSEEKKGGINYGKYFSIDWEDDLSAPVLGFLKPPREIVRTYDKGQWMELGVEEISRYHVAYRDGVEADFERQDRDGFRFTFSTGFRGSFWREADGSYMLNFKGDRLKPGEDDYRSQSKFIVSRSKFTNKLLLILQDEAFVTLG